MTEDLTAPPQPRFPLPSTHPAVGCHVPAALGSHGAKGSWLYVWFPGF